MKKDSRIVSSDDTIRKEFNKARRLVLQDSDVKDYLRRKPITRTKVLIAFWRINPTTRRNLKEIKEKSIKGYKRLVDNQIQSLDMTVERYARSHSTIPYSDIKPVLLCKYMPKDFAVSNIIHSEAKYGSVGEYRKDDDMECRLPIAPEMNTDEFLDVVRARILKSMLEEQCLDMLSIWNRVQDAMENNVFIGCFSDGKNPDHMWQKYAKENGVCVWFEPDYSKLKVIVYSDYLAEADNLREKYDKMMLRIAKEGFDSFKDELESLTEEIINLSYMSFYTKRPDYDKETEWRQLTSCNDPSRIMLDEDGLKYIVEPIPGRIVRVESRLPKTERDQLMANIDSEMVIEVDNENVMRIGCR